MPWNKNTFRSRHNKGLSDSQAKEAARIANAIYRETGDEAKAIKVANSKVKRKHG